VGAENLCHLCRCVLWTPATRSRVRHVAGRSWPRQTCDDLGFVGLKLAFLVVTRAVSLLGLSRRESWWKDAQILMLRHQLAVAERGHPRAHSRLTWPDRAWPALLAGTLPIGRLIIVLREYEDFYNTHRPHRTLKQAAPLRPMPDGLTDLDRFRVRRRDRAGGVIHEYRLVA
jgi:hypothetical protein